MLLLFSDMGLDVDPGPGTGVFIMAQGSSALDGNDITLGNGVLYYAPAMPDLVTAQASTLWRRAGMMKTNITVNGQQTTLDFVSGVPSGIVKRFITGQDFSISGDLLEFRPENLSLVLGGSPITRTLATTPAATTIAATPASTKTVLQLTSGTGLAKEDMLQVGTQFGKIFSVVGNVVTLYEGLSADTVPTSGTTVTKIQKSTLSVGNASSQADVAIKLSHTMASGNGSYDIYMLKANFTTDLSIVFQDNNKSPDGLALPFTVTAFKDNLIENGKIAFFDYTHS